jgi:hypothetical protein
MFKIKNELMYIAYIYNPPFVVDCCIALFGFQKPSPKNLATAFKPMDLLESAVRRFGSRKKASFRRLVNAAAAIAQDRVSELAVDQCFHLTEEV